MIQTRLHLPASSTSFGGRCVMNKYTGANNTMHRVSRI